MPGFSLAVSHRQETDEGFEETWKEVRFLSENFEEEILLMDLKGSNEIELRAISRKSLFCSANLISQEKDRTIG